MTPSLPSTAPETALRHGRGPLRVTWEPHGTPTEGGSLALTARIERRPDVDRPLHVVVRVPQGVHVIHGPLEFDLSPSPAVRIDAFEYVLALAAVPVADLVLIADAQGVGWGVHSEVPYRFGRAELIAQGPAAVGPHVIVGGIDLGSAVPAGRQR